MRLALPTSGVVDQTTHADRSAVTNAPGFMLGVWPHQGASGRRVLGQRPGVALAFPGYAPRQEKPVNALGVIGRSLKVQQGWGAFQIVQGPGMSASAPDGGTVPQAIPTGFAVSVLGLDGGYVMGFVDASYTSAVGRVAFGRRAAENGGTDWTGGATVVGGWSNKVVKAYGGAVGNKVISRIHLWDAGTSATAPLVAAFTVEVEDTDPGEAVTSGAQPMQVEACELVGPYLLAVAGGYLYCFDARPASVVGSQPRYIGRTNFAGWSWLTEDVSAWASGPVTRSDGSVQPAYGYAFVAYRGTPEIGGYVTTNDRQEGSYIRSAVGMVELVFPETETALSPDRPIRVGEAVFFRKGAATNSHGEDQADWRPAEWMDDGKGRAIICIDAYGPFQSQGLETAADREAWLGRVMIGTTNDGFAEPGVPDGNLDYWNVCTIDWPQTMGVVRSPRRRTEDVSSRKVNWLGEGWYNDVPFAIDGSILDNTGVGPKSSVASIVSAQNGIWMGGSFADGAKVRGRLAFTSGNVTTYPESWTKDLGTHVGRGALAVEVWPQQGVSHVIAVGTRNNTWEDSGGQHASAWLMNARNGSIERTWDFGSSVSARNAAFIRVGERCVAVVTHQVT